MKIYALMIAVMVLGIIGLYFIYKLEGDTPSSNKAQRNKWKAQNLAMNVRAELVQVLAAESFQVLERISCPASLKIARGRYQIESDSIDIAFDFCIRALGRASSRSELEADLDSIQRAIRSASIQNVMESANGFGIPYPYLQQYGYSATKIINAGNHAIICFHIGKVGIEK